MKIVRTSTVIGNPEKLDLNVEEAYGYRNHENAIACEGYILKASGFHQSNGIWYAVIDWCDSSLAGLTYQLVAYWDSNMEEVYLLFEAIPDHPALSDRDESCRIENPENLDLGIQDTVLGYSNFEHVLRAEGFFQEQGIWYATIKWYVEPVENCRLTICSNLKKKPFIQVEQIPTWLIRPTETMLRSYPRGINGIYAGPIGGWILYQTNVFPIGTPGCYQGVYKTEEEAWTIAWLLAGVLVLVTEYGMDTEGEE